MNFITADGTNIYYELGGHGPFCLAIHGGLGFDHIYMKTLSPLEDSLRLCYYDQRCNGRSGGELGPLTMERLADDAAEMVSALSDGPAVILGHSYGGFVAQELAIRHPEVVRALILVDTTPGQLGTNEVPVPDGPPVPAEMQALFARGPASEAEAELFAAELLPFYFHRPLTTETAALLQGTRFSIAAMGRGFELLAGWSSVGRLASIAAPTLLLWGRHDVVTSFPQASRIASRIPNSTVESFEAGHFPWLEEPEPFFDATRGWLKSQGLVS